MWLLGTNFLFCFVSLGRVTVTGCSSHIVDQRPSMFLHKGWGMHFSWGNARVEGVPVQGCVRVYMFRLGGGGGSLAPY